VRSYDGLLETDEEQECSIGVTAGKPTEAKQPRALVRGGAFLALLSLAALMTPWKQSVAGLGDSLTSLYLPHVHARITAEAFEEVKTSAPVSGLLKDPIINKDTGGTCAHAACSASRGPTDCWQKKCYCKYGYGAVAGKCEPLAKVPATVHTETTGTCNWLFKCNADRGPTTCQKGKCACQEGYVTTDQYRCFKNEEVISDMLAVGIVEPDAMPCPGSTVEMGLQFLRNVLHNKTKYDVSICRLSIQVYHGSPLPLVNGSSLSSKAEDNGDTSGSNEGKARNLYSLMTFRQWRTSMVQLMSKEFVYALVTSDLSASARRLGNIFHTLTDTWSASHVVRHVPASKSAKCEKFRVLLPISMDTVDWVRHRLGDDAIDSLWYCAKFFVAQGIDVWARARRSPVTTAAQANKWIDELIQKVLCPSLSIDPSDLGKPAGGASADWASTASEGKELLPVGTVAEKEALEIVAGYEDTLAEATSEADAAARAKFGKNVFFPDRAVDACEQTTAAHVTQDFVKRALEGTDENYLMPADALPPGKHKILEVPDIIDAEESDAED